MRKNIFKGHAWIGFDENTNHKVFCADVYKLNIQDDAVIAGFNFGHMMWRILYGNKYEVFGG